MSVKFAKEVITEATVPGGKQGFGLDISKTIREGGKQGFGLDIGKTLSGGGSLQQGYLAVRKHQTRRNESFRKKKKKLMRFRRLILINFREIPFVLKC